MPGFIQIMEFETSQIDELEALMKTFQKNVVTLFLRPRLRSPRTEPGRATTW